MSNIVYVTKFKQKSVNKFATPFRKWSPAMCMIGTSSQKRWTEETKPYLSNPGRPLCVTPVFIRLDKIARISMTTSCEETIMPVSFICTAVRSRGPRGFDAMKGQPQRLNSAPRRRGLNELSSVRITDQWALTDLSWPVTRLGNTKLRRPPCSVCVWHGTSFKRTSKEEIVRDMRSLMKSRGTVLLKKNK